MWRGVLLVWFAGSCAAADDPMQVLAHLRERVAAENSRIANYTCVQSVSREYFNPSFVRPPESCDDLLGHRKAGDYKLTLWSVDRLRLDVAVTTTREIYSWVGAREFDNRDLSEIVSGGPIGTGAFGAFLISIFGNPAALFGYVGDTQIDGRAVMEFTYRVTKESSHYRVAAGSDWIVTGYDGTVYADPTTSDIVRLTIRTDELPPETGSCETRTDLDYHRVRVGERELLLPRATHQRFIVRSGVETENTTVFTDCREYLGHSTIRFGDDAADAPAQAAAKARAAPQPIPADLPVILDLTAPIDTWTASGGDMVSLRLAKPIVDAGKKVLVPAGVLVEARLIRVQRYLTKPTRATVVMKPETIERNGGRAAFPVLPAKLQPIQVTRVSGFRTHTLTLREAPMPNEVTFGVFQEAGDHVILPKGYHTDWLTAIEKK